MATIDWEKRDSVTIINMCNGANKQNLEFVADMNRCLDRILKDTDIYAVVL